MCVCACTHTRQCRYRAVTQPHVCVCVTRGPQSPHTLAGGPPPRYLSGAGHAGAAWHWVQPSGASAGDEAKPGRVRSGDSSWGPAMARSSCSDGARAVGPGMAMAVPESRHQTPPRWAGGHSCGPSQCPRGSRRVQDACGPKACPGGAWVTAGAGSRCQGTPGVARAGRGVSGHHGGNWELRWGWDKQVSLRSMGLAGSVLVGAVGQGCSQPGRAKRRQLPAARGTVRPELRAGGHQGLWLPEGRDQELGVTAGPQDSTRTHTAWAPIVRHTAGVRRAEVEPGGGVSSKPGQDRVQ